MRVVIVGGGVAAARAAESARSQGLGGELVLVGDEPHLPYHRPPLSKEWLIGASAEDVTVHPGAFYDAHGIEVIRGRRAVHVDIAGRSVVLDDGRALAFDQLLIATGSRPRRLAVDGAGLPGVHTLRTVDDGRDVASRLAAAHDVVVVGAGLIGLEVASAARALGKRVTVLDRAGAPLQRLVGPQLGELVARLCVDAGVDLRPGVLPTRILGAEAVEAVDLTDGSRVRADLVVVGIGAVPATGWLEGSGLRLDGGVLVDERLRTAVPGVLAAGDVARAWVPRYRAHLRIEHYGNTHAQGLAAGEALAGREIRLDPIPGASSDLFGRRLQVTGLVRGDEEVVLRGADERPTAFYLRDGRIVAAVSLDGGRDFLAARKLVAAGAAAERVP